VRLYDKQSGLRLPQAVALAAVALSLGACGSSSSSSSSPPPKQTTDTGPAQERNPGITDTGPAIERNPPLSNG
jgi:hypothetical protein